jgi:hypothetical protein
LATEQTALNGIYTCICYAHYAHASAASYFVGVLPTVLQNSVRIEVAAAVEPLKQLPQLVAAAAAKAAAQQQQQQQALQAEGLDESAGSAGLSSSSSAAAAVDQSLLLEQLRELVAAEVAAATQQIMNQQVRFKHSTTCWRPCNNR